MADALRLAVQQGPLRGKVWVTQTGCLTFCNPNGATVVAYPAGQWFSEVTVADVPALVKQLQIPTHAKGFPI